MSAGTDHRPAFRVRRIVVAVAPRIAGLAEAPASLPYSRARSLHGESNWANDCARSPGHLGGRSLLPDLTVRAAAFFSLTEAVATAAIALAGGLSPAGALGLTTT